MNIIELLFDDLPHLAKGLVLALPVSKLALLAAVPHGEAATALLRSLSLATISGASSEVPARRLLLASPRLLAGCLAELGEHLQHPGVGGAEREGRHIPVISDEGIRPVLQQEGHQVEVLVVCGEKRSSGYRHCETLL